MLYPRYLCVCVAIIILCLTVERAEANGWRTASRESAGIAPDPAVTTEAIIQVYGARAYSWRGYFGIHTWIAVKPTSADAFTVYEVIGWRLKRNRRVLVSHQNPPDSRWFDSMPEVLADKRGEGVDELIVRIEKAARDYPFKRQYSVWPGPNSNTFTAWVSRFVPELELDLPPTAIGKDFLGHQLFDSAPSGSGFQISFYGILGILVSQVEGIELNLLGLSFGIDPVPLALKLPMVGRINLIPAD
ncbi:MAG: DUF3750 domain-containing protein [Nitrosomonas sp.]|nr:DUF3750 domain-containing protein [Nitrosomonas sp.]